MTSPLTLSLTEISAGLRRGEWTPTHLVEAAREALTAADAGSEPIHAFLSVDLDRAREQARQVEEEVRRDEGTRPLAGIPVAVKDNIATLDFPTTCGSRILEGYRSPFEATSIRRLREAGAILIGKTNLDEFAMGSSTENSAYGITRNPRDRSRVSGGSSGGSAAAVAAGIVPVALGSETGGSVRQPAAFCGIVGIKPTYGRVSRYGLIAFASSLDQIGCFGRTVDDAMLLLRIISGHDPHDSTSVPRPAGELDAVSGQDLKGVVIGVPEEYFPSTLDPRIAGLCDAALRRLKERGAVVREISLPHTPYALPTYYIIAPAEASANLARFDGVRYGVRAPEARSLGEMYDRTRALFGPEVRRRIMLGTYVLSAGYYEAYYGQAQRVRALICEDFRRVFNSGVDAIFTPTTPTPAFRLGERLTDPYEMYLSDIFTVTANLAGIPAFSLPIGEVDSLPVGGQLLGQHWEEAKLARIAEALEEG